MPTKKTSTLLDTSAYKKMVEKVVAKYPNIRVVSTTLREVKSSLINNWSANPQARRRRFYESRRIQGPRNRRPRQRLRRRLRLRFRLRLPHRHDPRRMRQLSAAPAAPSAKPPAATPPRSPRKNSCTSSKAAAPASSGKPRHPLFPSFPPKPRKQFRGLFIWRSNARLSATASRFSNLYAQKDNPPPSNR